MADRQFIGLDNPAFAGRLKTYEPRPTVVIKRSQPIVGRNVEGVRIHKAAILPADSIEPIVVQAAPVTFQPRSVAVEPPPPQNILPVEDPTSTEAVSPVDVPAQEPMPRSRKAAVQRKVLPALAVLLFVIGLGVSLSVLRSNNQATATVHAMSSEAEEAPVEKPDETEPKDISSYKVAPDMPRYVRVKSIGLTSRVKRVSVDANNKLKAPGNIYDVGWYDGSSKPGDAGGAALFDAHVSGPTRPGAFKKIDKLAAGDTIEVEQGDGKKFTYKVVKSKVFEKDAVDMASALVSVEAGKAGLNLMTCAGPLKGDDYQQRLIVYAVQI